MAWGILGILNTLGNIASAGAKAVSNLADGTLLIKFTQKTLIEGMTNTVNAYKSIDKSATDMVRALGGGVNAIREISRYTLNAVHDLKIAENYNISTEELLRAQADYQNALGRTVRFSQGKTDENGNIIEGTSQIERLAQLQRVFQDNTTSLLSEMELYGLGIDDVSERSLRMYKTAQKSGLSLSKYTDSIVKNMKMAQNFTFKNGLKGLENMAKKSLELKMDMAQIEGMANKLNTIEGSITTAAKLQVLGGPFAQLSDPLSMLSESLTDMEGLQDRMIKMFSGLGSFNKKTGEIEVSSFSKRQIREATSALGVDYNQIMNMIQSSARRDEVERQVKEGVGENAFSKDFLEILKNNAQFRNGQAIYSDGNQEYTIEQLAADTDAQKNIMANYQDERRDIKDIALSVISIEEKVEGVYKQLITGKAYAESEGRYREGGRTNLELVEEFFRNANKNGIDFNKIGESLNVASNFSASIFKDLSESILPQFSTLTTKTDNFIDALGTLVGKLNEGVGRIIKGISVGGEASAPASLEGIDPGIFTRFMNWLTANFSNPIQQSLVEYSNEGTVPELPSLGLGGPVIGESHAKGGVPLVAEGGEFVVNKNTMDNYGPLIETMNTIGAKQYHLGGYVGGIGRNANLQVSFRDTNTDILESIDASIKSLDTSRYTIRPTITNGIQTYRVSEKERDIIQGRKETEKQTPQEMTVNIKFSDLLVKGDGIVKNILPSIVNSSEFVDKVRNMILNSLPNKSDKAEKKISDI